MGMLGGVREVDGTERVSAGDALPQAELLKKAAAEKALALVESRMVLGLGTGSTARWLVAGLGEKLAAGELQSVSAVPTSEATRAQAEGLGIPLVELPRGGVDLAVDGMDELAPGLDAIKGLGGALTREKVVAAAAARFVLIGDDSKLVSALGEKAPVPVEVVAFGHERTASLLTQLGADPVLRLQAGEPVVTDNSNLVYDCTFAAGFDPAAVAAELKKVTGVVEHGLFLKMAELAYVATTDSVLELTRSWRQ